MNSQYPEIPLSFEKLKSQTRSGLSSEARQYWWPFFPSLAKGANIDHYPNIAETAENRFQWAKNNLSGGLLKEDSSSNSSVILNAQNILLLLSNQFEIQESALILPLIVLIRKVIPNDALCFYMGCGLLENSEWL